MVNEILKVLRILELDQSIFDDCHLKRQYLPGRDRHILFIAVSRFEHAHELHLSRQLGVANSHFGLILINYTVIFGVDAIHYLTVETVDAL